LLEPILHLERCCRDPLQSVFAPSRLDVDPTPENWTI
jgi:hypothetical protein